MIPKKIHLLHKKNIIQPNSCTYLYNRNITCKKYNIYTYLGIYTFIQLDIIHKICIYTYGIYIYYM